ncbi:MAG: hypothetical protein RI953_1495 [Pseudomonadota bacterium]
MNFKRFAESGGFKLLAVARFSGPAYALISYLLNGLAARVEEVVTSPGELALILGVTERQIKSALSELAESGVVQVTERNGSTCLLRMNLDTAHWRKLAKTPDAKNRRGLGDAKNVRTLHPQPPVPNGSHPVDMDKVTTETPQDKRKGKKKAAAEQDGLSAHEALVFPARSKAQKPGLHLAENPHLVSIEGGRNNRHSDEHPKAGARSGTQPEDIPGTVEHESQRILESFLKLRSSEQEFDRERELDYARLLAESHPTEHVLQLITHFGKEVPSLALLAGAWMHYSDTFHKHQNEQVDLESYRQRHMSAEKRIRTLANTELKKAQANKSILSADEQLLLRIFLRHEQPRRQLYWALKVRERYPHLHDFFAVTADLALPPNHHEGPHRKG